MSENGADQASSFFGARAQEGAGIQGLTAESSTATRTWRAIVHFFSCREKNKCARKKKKQGRGAAAARDEKD